MKTKTFALSILGALVLLAVLLPSPTPGGQHIALASGTATLMSAQTSNGPGLASVSSAATPVEGGSDRWTFLYACRNASGAGSARCGVRLEISLNGTDFTALHRFSGGDEVFERPTCGACVLRAIGDDLGTDHKATLTVAASGGTAPFAPTYTPTSTPTLTPTH